MKTESEQCSQYRGGDRTGPLNSSVGIVPSDCRDDRSEHQQAPHPEIVLKKLQMWSLENIRQEVTKPHGRCARAVQAGGSGPVMSW